MKIARVSIAAVMPLLAQALLTLLYARALNGVASITVLLVLLVAAAAAGSALGAGHLRVWLLFVIAGAAWIALHAVAIGVLAAMVNATGSIDAARLVGRVDALATAAIPVVLLAFSSAVAVRRDPRISRWEPLLHAALLLAILWSQAHYKLTYFNRPWAYVLVVGALVVIDAVVLLEPRAQRGKTLVRAAILALPLLAAAIALSVLWYTSGGTQAGGGLLRPTLFRFDFAPFVKLESEISMSDDLVLLYRRSGHPRRDLIRRFVLSDYDARRGFSVAPGDDDHSQDDSEREEVRQEYFLVNLDPQTRLALNAPTGYTQFESWDDSSFTSAFAAESLVSTAPPYRLARVTDASLPDPRLVDYGGNQAIHDLALQVTADVDGPFAKARAIESYLQNNYYYSLRPGIAPDGDQLGYFLFTTKKGYCSYFAFSMALMVRSLGIPARVAVGFFVDPSQEALNFYPVLANMAHAWVEVYLGRYGWISFDPTSQTLAPGEQYEFGQGADPNELSRLLQEILSQQLRPIDATAAPNEDHAPAGLPRFVRETIARWYLVLPALYALYLLITHQGWRLVLLSVRDPRRRAIVRIRAFLQHARLVGVYRRVDESLRAFGERAGIGGFATLMALYERLLFSPSADADPARVREETSGAVAEASRNLRARTPMLRRMRAAIDPRPPRFGRTPSGAPRKGR